VIGDAEPQHRGIAEPVGRPARKDLGDVDRVEPPGINPVGTAPLVKTLR
jgi:hypothetical protein